MEDLKAVIGEVRGQVDRCGTPQPEQLAGDADNGSAVAALALP